jgi:hypothetical protein
MVRERVLHVIDLVEKGGRVKFTERHTPTPLNIAVTPLRLCVGVA